MIGPGVHGDQVFRSLLSWKSAGFATDLAKLSGAQKPPKIEML